MPKSSPKPKAPDKVSDYETLLAQYKEKFHCSICGTPSVGPKVIYKTGMILTITQLANSKFDWDFPNSDLKRCVVCGELVCISTECYRDGFCKKCSTHPIRRFWFELKKL